LGAKARRNGCLGKREIGHEELLVVELHPAVLVAIETRKGFRELFDEHTCTYEAVERDSLLAWHLRTGGRGSYGTRKRKNA
jgi:hypothetical protein